MKIEQIETKGKDNRTVAAWTEEAGGVILGYRGADETKVGYYFRGYWHGSFAGVLEALAAYVAHTDKLLS